MNYGDALVFALLILDLDPGNNKSRAFSGGGIPEAGTDAL